MISRLHGLVDHYYTNLYEEDDGTDFADWVEDEIKAFKQIYQVNDKVSEFFGIVIEDAKRLYNQCESLITNNGEIDEDKADRMTQDWSVYKLLEDWKKQQQTVLP